MKKIVILIIIAIVAILIWYTLSISQSEKHTTAVLTAKQSISTTPIISLSPTPGIPQTISISKISVTTSIEQVSQDKNGQMETPLHAEDTGWYSLGFRPGQKGNAVIDGHLDTVTGAPAAFWNIKNLLPGDKIITTDSNQKSYTFTVTKTVSYPYNQVPLQQIFAVADRPHLNLITCIGTWDKTHKNYSNRLVVYAEIRQ